MWTFKATTNQQPMVEAAQQFASEQIIAYVVTTLVFHQQSGGSQKHDVGPVDQQATITDIHLIFTRHHSLDLFTDLLKIDVIKLGHKTLLLQRYRRFKAELF